MPWCVAILLVCVSPCVLHTGRSPKIPSVGRSHCLGVRVCEGDAFNGEMSAVWVQSVWCVQSSGLDSFPFPLAPFPPAVFPAAAAAALTTQVLGQQSRDFGVVVLHAHRGQDRGRELRFVRHLVRVSYGGGRSEQDDWGWQARIQESKGAACFWIWK